MQNPEFERFCNQVSCLSKLSNIGTCALHLQPGALQPICAVWDDTMSLCDQKAFLIFLYELDDSTCCEYLWAFCEEHDDSERSPGAYAAAWADASPGMSRNEVQGLSQADAGPLSAARQAFGELPSHTANSHQQHLYQQGLPIQMAFRPALASFLIFSCIHHCPGDSPQQSLPRHWHGLDRLSTATPQAMMCTSLGPGA